MKRIYTKTRMLIVMALVSMLSLTSCHIHDCYDCNTPPPPPCSYGPDGYAGPAFFGLDYTTVEPSYIWTNNTAIPSVFRYGDYYNSLPGNFQLYYEGAFYDGCCLTEYYWDVYFDVWINGGTPGGCGYAGQDGLPSYLMMVMGPYGPGEHRTNKMAEAGIEVREVFRTDDEIVTEYTKGDIVVKVTYKRLQESKRGELDATGEIAADISKPKTASK